MLTPRELEKAILDVINWTARDDVNKSEIARVSGLTRQTVHKPSEPGWDPPISTIITLAEARQTIMKQAKKERVNA